MTISSLTVFRLVVGRFQPLQPVANVALGETDYR
jgi:hypothetical protein